MTAKRRLIISLASAAVLAVLLAMTDWGAGTWQQVVGAVLAVALLANLWGAVVAWRAMRGGR
jgi:hypothetical protein